jgi:OCT family organic cation transporter-like MFS transporter 18
MEEGSDDHPDEPDSQTRHTHQAVVIFMLMSERSGIKIKKKAKMDGEWKNHFDSSLGDSDDRSFRIITFIKIMAQMEKKSSSSQNDQYILWIVYLNVALYATCFQIQRPLEPFLVDKLIKNGATDSGQEYAKLQSFFSIIQMVGSLISGRMLDRFGVKGGFVVNFVACALCYGLLSQATTLPILYASKVPSVFQMGFLCAQVAASQVTSDGPERVQALGRLTMSYTVGSVLGPTIGGFLGASGDYYFGAKLAVVGSVISIFLTFLLPNDIQQKRVGEDESLSGSSKTKKTFPSIWNVISLVWVLLSAKVITSVANAMATTVFPIVLKNNYQVDEKGLGMIMSASSAFNAVVSGLFLAPLTSWLGGDLSFVIFNCLLAMTTLSLVQGLATLETFSTSFGPLYGMLSFVGVGFAISIFQYVLATTITSESTTRVGPDSKGTLLGLEHSLFAAARVASPQLGIYILQSNGISAVCIACSAIFGVVSVLWQMFHGASLSKNIVKESERKEK